MWPSADVAAGIAGAIKLARFDPDGFEHFDTSITGFWRSFLAAVVIAPLFMVLLVIRYIAEPTAGSFLHYIILECEAYVIAWFAFPLIVAYLSRALGKEDRYLGYIVAYNWAAVAQSVVYLPIVILGMTGALPQGIASVFALVAIFWILSLTFFVTRHAFDVAPGTAAGIVFMDFLLGMVIESTTNRFL
ncbi:MAG: hypothetical protein OXR84_02750 [Magnetovibrio sp.]|nr:hypothetical protein [Magnetovibrio sp.]